MPITEAVVDKLNDALNSQMHSLRLPCTCYLNTSLLPNPSYKKKLQ